MRRIQKYTKVIVMKFIERRSLNTLNETTYTAGARPIVFSSLLNFSFFYMLVFIVFIAFIVFLLTRIASGILNWGIILLELPLLLFETTLCPSSSL